MASSRLVRGNDGKVHRIRVTDEEWEEVLEAVQYEGDLSFLTEAISEREVRGGIHGREPWKPKKDMDPWERLAAAIVGKACEDYLEAYERGDGRAMEELRDWFSENEYAEVVFRHLERLIHKAKSKREFLRLKRIVVKIL